MGTSQKLVKLLLDTSLSLWLQPSTVPGQGQRGWNETTFLALRGSLCSFQVLQHTLQPDHSIVVFCSASIFVVDKNGEMALPPYGRVPIPPDQVVSASSPCCAVVLPQPQQALGRTGL